MPGVKTGAVANARSLALLRIMKVDSRGPSAPHRTTFHPPFVSAQTRMPSIVTSFLVPQSVHWMDFQVSALVFRSNATKMRLTLDVALSFTATAIVTRSSGVAATPKAVTTAVPPTLSLNPS
jgi:hypothetical protein